MINLIVEFSKYIILTLMIVYTFYCFYLVFRHNEFIKRESLKRQVLMVFFIDFVAFLILYLKTLDFSYVIFYSEMMVFFVILLTMYSIVYKKASFLLLNNTFMLLSIGFIMLARLSLQSANRQLLIVVGSSIISFVIPPIMKRIRFLKKLVWFYGAVGIVLLGAVLVMAKTSYGAKLSLLGIQPSELIKISFVFFLASILSGKVSYKKIILASIIAFIHVGILVLSRDLGSGVIFFMTYLLLIYAATRNPLYLIGGFSLGSVGSVVAYYLFGHVRQRVIAWKNPMAVYKDEGYQIVQSLFAIGTGGWFGMGLMQGSPEKIPVVKNDFIFSAICEEMGGIFAICVILVCISFFLMIVNIATKLNQPFYKLLALGLGIEYGFQVFLTIGGVTKFIPMTGVTLPLVAYGGTSVLSTLLMVSIIQGMYILREDPKDELERQRRLGREI